MGQDDHAEPGHDAALDLRDVARIAFVVLVAAGVVARSGAAPLAAHQIALQLWLFLALVLDAYAIAAQTLVGQALAYGVKVTGATVHLVDAEVDSGPVLAQQAVAVHPGDTETVLHERIKTVERRLLVDTIAALASHGATVGGRKVSIP